MRGDALLEVRGLCKQFGATRALDDVSLAFQAGEIHCVLGENGAGKSTLGKIIGGVHVQDQGDIVLGGRRVRMDNVSAARALGVAVVFQELSLAPDLSVRANLLLGTERRGHAFARLDRASELARVRNVLGRLGLTVDPEQRVAELPVAVQQMLEVGKALIREPRIVVLDEPTAMLSAPDKQRLFEVLSGLRDDGKALVFITHHLEDVNAIGDRVTILRNGRVVESFVREGDCDPDAVLEALSGKRMTVGTTHQRRAPGDARVRIDGLHDHASQAATLTLNAGEIVGLYGVVGCGAEAVARALAGVTPASALSIELDGARVSPSHPAHARSLGIAYLPSGRARNGILPTRSIRENLNVSMLARYARCGVVPARRERAGARELLAANAVKFADTEDDITALSGGNQQKVLMARVLGSNAGVLVLEDPTAGIDIGAKLDIQAAIHRRADDGAAVLLVSSDLVETLTMCDTVYTMYAGRLVRRYAQPGLDDQPAVVADVVGQDVQQCASSGQSLSLEHRAPGLSDEQPEQTEQPAASERASLNRAAISGRLP
jgi:ribose transport system ATP-binding protein